MKISKPVKVSRDLEDGRSMNILAGVIATEDLMRLKRMIFRASKGRAYPTFFEFYPTFDSNNVIPKKIYFIFYQDQSVLLSKIVKVCDIFNASRFNIPDLKDFEGVLVNLDRDINQKRSMLKELHTTTHEFIRDKIGSVILII